MHPQAHPNMKAEKHPFNIPALKSKEIALEIGMHPATFRAKLNNRPQSERDGSPSSRIHEFTEAEKALLYQWAVKTAQKLLLEEHYAKLPDDVASELMAVLDKLKRL